MQSKPKLIWADNLRAVATMAIIMLHASAGILTQFGKVPDSTWQIGCLYNGIVRFGVPVFVMLSGVFLLDREYPLFDFLKRRFTRILYPFLFWSLAYIAVSLYFKQLHGYTFELTKTSTWIGTQLLNGSSYHFWYIYMILGLYLFIPILGKWIRNCPRKEIYYFLIIWFGSQLLNLPVMETYKPKLRLDYFTDYGGYLVLGYLLSKLSFANINRKKTIAFLLFILGAGYTVGITYYLSYLQHKTAGNWFNPLSPNIMLMAATVFLFFKNLTIKNPIMINTLGFISRYSFGIYLVHVLVLSRMANWFGIHWNCTHPALAIPLTTIMCLIISATIIFLINKLPGGKYVSG